MKHPSILHSLLFLLLAAAGLQAGISREMQNYYLRQYENRALYLKIPVHGFRQTVQVEPRPELDGSTLGLPVAFKVGEQVRITDLNFKDEFIRFKIAAVDFSREAEIVFQFSSRLTNDFPQGGQFDRALEFTFTAGVDYKEIDAAKETFIADQFDRLIEQFATTTGTSREYVIQTISEKNPDFERNKRLLAQRDREMAGLRQQLAEAERAKNEAESGSGRLVQRVREAEAEADSLKIERNELLDERDSLRERLEETESGSRNWQRQKQEYESRIAGLLGSLDAETGSRNELSSQVAALDTAIQGAKAERAALAGELEEARRQTAQLQEENRQKSAEVQTLEADRKKLSDDLRSLTSDRKGLNSRYLETRRKGEALEAALQLASAITLRRQPEGAEGAALVEVGLLDRKLATLRVEDPAAEPFRVRFEMVSPDTVEFSEEERRLWGALAEGTSVRAVWSGASPGVQPALVEGEAQQLLAPREAAEWTFRLPSAPASSEPLRLEIALVDPDGREVPLGGLDFQARPGGLGGVLGGLSWLTLLIGLAVGASAAFLLLALRKHPA